MASEQADTLRSEVAALQTQVQAAERRHASEADALQRDMQHAAADAQAAAQQQARQGLQQLQWELQTTKVTPPPAHCIVLAVSDSKEALSMGYGLHSGCTIKLSMHWVYASALPESSIMWP